MESREFSLRLFLYSPSSCLELPFEILSYQAIRS